MWSGPHGASETMMTDLLRQEIATAAHTVIVKVGTRVLTGTMAG